VFDWFNVSSKPRNILPSLTSKVLAQCLESLPQTTRTWFDPITTVCQERDITTAERLAAFFAQLGHESGGLSILRENLNYSSSRLLQVFPKRFTQEEAIQYAQHPEMIGNRVYANRNGNGDEASGDGFRYSARGPIGLTFKNNYREAGAVLNLDLVKEPDLVLDPWIGARVAGWFWARHNLNELADLGDMAGIGARLAERFNTEKRSTGLFWKTNRFNTLSEDSAVTQESAIINGGTNGLEDRLRRYHLAIDILKQI
jgi:putative chitinase